MGWNSFSTRERKFSRPIARFLARKTKLTPNHVTIISFTFGVLSGISFFLRRNIIGGILAQLASIMDGVDGDLAILTGKESMFGGYLDSLLDRYSDGAIILGLMFNALVFNADPLKVFIVSFAALLGSLMISYSRSKAESLDIVFKAGVSRYAANRDVRLFIVLIGGILNQSYITLITLATLTNLVVCKRLLDVRGEGLSDK